MSITVIESKALEYVAYDEVTKVLLVQFDFRGSYKYYDVPRDVVDGLIASIEPGRYFNKVIRSAQYKFERITK